MTSSHGEPETAEHRGQGIPDRRDAAALLDCVGRLTGLEVILVIDDEPYNLRGDLQHNGGRNGNV